MAQNTHDITMNFTANTSQAEAAIQKLKGSTEQAAGGLEKQAKSSGTAAYALTNFNRVVQDAPFGIMGVANNIDPLVQSFQKLKAETGSTGGAFKEMIKTLSGPTGVLLGINMAIFALQVLPGLLKNISKASLDVAKDFNKVRDAVIEKTFADDKDIKGLVLKQVKIEAVTAALKKGALGTQEKKFWIEELNKEYKPYLENLGKQKIDESKLEAALRNVNIQLQTKIDNMINEKVVDKMGEEIAAKRVQAYKLRTSNKTILSDINELKQKYGITDTDITKAIEYEMTSNTPAVMGAPRIRQTGAVWLPRAKELIKKFRENMANVDKFGKEYQDALKELTQITGESNFTFGKTAVTPETPANDPTAKEKIKEIKKLAEITIADLMRRTMMNYMSQFAKAKDMDALPISALSNMTRSDGNFADPFTMDQSNVPWAKKRDEGYKKLRDEAKARLDAYKNYFIDPFTSAFKSEFSKAWNSIFGEANSLLEQFIQNVAQAFYNQGVEKLAWSLVKMIPGFGDAAAASGGGSGGGERNLTLVVDSEVVATQRLARASKAIIDRTAALL